MGVMADLLCIRYFGLILKVGIIFSLQCGYSILYSSILILLFSSGGREGASVWLNNNRFLWFLFTRPATAHTWCKNTERKPNKKRILITDIERIPKRQQLRQIRGSGVVSLTVVRYPPKTIP